MSIKDRLDCIRKRIEAAAVRCGRDPKSVRLVTVSKTFPAETVREAIEAGADILGENYIQEARSKHETLSDCPVSWHYIGHLQSNKAKYAVRFVDLIHSVDSLKLAKEIDKQAAKCDKIQNILIQVNIGKEDSKSGVFEEDAVQLVRDAGTLDHVAVKGLMIIPPFYDEPERVRPFFAGLRNLAEKIRAMNIPGVSMTELSMGMSGDFETAIENGATLVRVGRSIFGERH